MGEKGTAPLIHNLVTRWRSVVSLAPGRIIPRERAPGWPETFVEEKKIRCTYRESITEPSSP